MTLQECFRPVANKERIILVEGPDDALVVEAICKEEDLIRSLQILCYSQVGKLGAFLDLLVKNAGFEVVQRVGLTRDADQGAERARQSLMDAWKHALNVLNTISRKAPEHSIFAIPDNQNAGRLENLCLQSPAFPALLTCAQQMYDCAKAVASYQIDREKSVVAAYLSMMGQARLQLGSGAQAGCWDLRSEAFRPLRDFVISVAT
jgi:hypothetical protein